MIESKELDRILSLQKEESLLHLLNTEEDCVRNYNTQLFRVHAYYDLMKKYAASNNELHQEISEDYKSDMIHAGQDFIKAESELKEIRAKIKAYIMNA